MNKYRILENDNQWRYFTVEVLDNRIVTVLKDKDGAQDLNPKLKLKKETLGKFTMFYDMNKREIYDMDILLIGGILNFVSSCVDGWRYSVWNASFSYPSLPLIEGVESGCEILGNIYQNPELLEITSE